MPMRKCRRDDCDTVQDVPYAAGAAPYCPPCRDRHLAHRLTVAPADMYKPERQGVCSRCDREYFYAPSLARKHNLCSECSVEWRRIQKELHAQRKMDRAASRSTDESRRARQVALFMKKLERFGLIGRYADFDAITCGICGRADPGGKGIWHVDHSHACCTKGCRKCVRGLLCWKCNVGLGHFEDNPAALAAAIVWIS